MVEEDTGCIWGGSSKFKGWNDAQNNYKLGHSSQVTESRLAGLILVRREARNQISIVTRGTKVRQGATPSMCHVSGKL